MVEYQLGGWDLSELAKNPKSLAFQKQIQELKKQAIKTLKNTDCAKDFLKIEL